MKTILYATDYSENSELALKFAYNMSIKLEAKLLVIHVFDYPTFFDDITLNPEAPFPDIEGHAFKIHNRKLHTFCNRVLKKDIATLNITIEAIEDRSVVNGIVNKANNVDALFIVTGMKGSSKLRELIMGSIAKKLIKKAPCPVLIIPSDSVKIEIETIVYATDFEEEDFGALAKLAEIAKPFNAKISVVHFSSSEETVLKKQKEELKEKLQKHINYDNLKLDILYADDTFKALKSYARNSSADLIAMLEREDKGITSKVFHRDLVKRIESYGKIPLLSFNAKNYGIFHLE
ncbi:nucleotide-binding universal stress UspA family protein [Winogradskyella pacifica]|uniref:Nucleotide-binding universal stress UspA family protein n=1 Tax=Winogradskyella pacifica TaxID=664642 RepID=A0A3D9LM53_9FLAO|nr:universal stress protein [Winogradskyella pacifica]REE07726.1 nucleotide-binding universal stress UspA family protein [Winogradskyella pacifica]